MKIKSPFLLLLLFWVGNHTAGQSKSPALNNYITQKKQKTIIEFRFGSKRLKDSVALGFRPVDDIGFSNWTSAKQQPTNRNVTWTFNTAIPIYIYTGDILDKQPKYWLTEPGDSITIAFSNEQLFFSGNGSEKFKLLYEIDSMQESIKKPSHRADYITKSLDDYYEWDHYLNKQLELVIPLINSYKNIISAYAYNYIKASFIDQNIDDRSDKFGSFIAFAKKTGIKNKIICTIYDSTYYPNIITWFDKKSSYVFGSWRLIKLKAWRKYSFDMDNDTLKSDVKRHLLYYTLGLKTYKKRGEIKEKFLLEFLTREMIDDLGFIPETEALLTKYYNEPGYPEYKNYVKEYEIKARILRKGKPAPDFTLSGINEKPFKKEDLHGKIALIDFWFTGCAGCVELTPVLRKIENEFKNDTNVIFLSVSIDKQKSKWLNSIKKGDYTTGQSLNLFTEGLGDKHAIIRNYNVLSYPSLYMLDAHGRIVENPLPDPRKDSGEQLTKLLKKQLTELNDGPYVLYENNNTNVYYINGSSVSVLKKEKQAIIPVQTDEYKKTFNITLKKNLNIEPSEFIGPEKLLAFSDIEGNFEAFRKLLLTNKIIDEQFNWTFGNGHLVFTGDMFDRGNQVTECLWLIYSLEEKAKAAGGYVHFIFGNHEIMNLNGNTRYSDKKYREITRKLEKSYAELYNTESELGKWLRTKNIIEKIGNILFVHGGISKEINDLKLSLAEINHLARKYYDREKEAINSESLTLKLLFGSKTAPHWYRFYYLDQDMEINTNGDTLYKASSNQVNATLKKFNVNHIVTGHTIYADTISIHYNGKVINIDTHHAAGKSEALLVEGKTFYKVTTWGEKIML